MFQGGPGGQPFGRGGMYVLQQRLTSQLICSIPPNHPQGARYDPFGPVGPDFGTHQYVD